MPKKAVKTISIHGKDYVTVAERVNQALDAGALEQVATEVISHDPVVVKATVTVKGKTFTGISSVPSDTQRMIEKSSPYEVAETSAVGRALGFAGYGSVESIASADEVIKAENTKPLSPREMGNMVDEASRANYPVEPVAPPVRTETPPAVLKQPIVDYYNYKSDNQLKVELSSYIHSGESTVTFPELGALTRAELITELNRLRKGVNNS